MKTVTKLPNKASTFLKSFAIVLSFLLASGSAVQAQTAVVCPQNIDFSFGNFNNWLCYTGTVNTGPAFNWSASPTGPIGGSAPSGALLNMLLPRALPLIATAVFLK